MKVLTKICCCFVLIAFCICFVNCSETTMKSVNARSIGTTSKTEDTPLKISIAANILPSQKTLKVSDKKVVHPVSNSTQTIASNKNSTKNTSNAPKPRKEKVDPYECPNTSDFTFFPTFCTLNTDCFRYGKEMRCCKQFNSKRCVKGVPKPIVEQRHEPILGVIPRKCPKEPLAELFWELKTCHTDHDCWPRICCPDGIAKYCRSSIPELDTLPVGRQFAYPIEALSGYLQCTPPPPLAYDHHPKVCNNTLDCFPNVCCQEAGKKHCRPPKRSLLAFVTTFAQRFNTGIIKQWTDNLVIRR